MVKSLQIGNMLETRLKPSEIFAHCCVIFVNAKFDFYVDI